MENCTNNNRAQLCGTVAGEAELSHELYGEKFFVFVMEVRRLSGAYDSIRVMVSERLLAGEEIRDGDFVRVSGQFRSYNSYENNRNRLILTLFARDIEKTEQTEADAENPNMIYLNGYICKEPIYRTTPFGREICDMLLAVNRSYNKSDYIPAIAWGRNARFCKNLQIGDNIQIWGRIQSREYRKKLSEEETVTKTAYEVSISKLSASEE